MGWVLVWVVCLFSIQAAWEVFLVLSSELATVQKFSFVVLGRCVPPRTGSPHPLVRVRQWLGHRLCGFLWLCGLG